MVKDISAFFSDELLEEIDFRIKNAKGVIEREEESRKLAEEVGESCATYTVRLRSLWKDHGGKDVERTGRNIPETIHEAEEEFREINRVGGERPLQAKYVVRVKIGTGEYPVPEEYWERGDSWKRKIN